MAEFDLTELRDVLSHLPTGVVIVSARVGADRVGMAVGSFTSVSLAPPLVGFFVDHGSTTWPQMKPSGRFAVNVLGETHRDLARRFSTRGVDRFAGSTWLSGEGDIPLLADALVNLVCDLERTVETGDHYLVLGKVVDVRYGDGDSPPLIFHRSGFHILHRGQTKEP